MTIVPIQDDGSVRSRSLKVLDGPQRAPKTGVTPSPRARLKAATLPPRIACVAPRLRRASSVVTPAPALATEVATPAPEMAPSVALPAQISAKSSSKPYVPVNKSLVLWVSVICLILFLFIYAKCSD